MNRSTIRARFGACAIALALAGACAAKPAPPPSSAAEDAVEVRVGGLIAQHVRIARIVRLMELNRRLIALEVERAGLSQRYGVNHPRMVSLTNQIKVIDEALGREFHPDEQAALAQYGDRAMELRLRIQELFARGRGENHPDVLAAQRQLASVEAMAETHRSGREEAAPVAHLTRDPDAVGPRLELALLYLRDGRRAAAEQALDRALKALRKQR